MRRIVLLISPFLTLGCAPQGTENASAATPKREVKSELKVPTEVRYRNTADFKNAELVLRQGPNSWVMTGGWHMGKEKMSGTWTREGRLVRLEFTGALKGFAFEGTMKGDILSFRDPFISGVPRKSSPAPFNFHRI